jgi:hypothetical protein
MKAILPLALLAFALVSLPPAAATHCPVVSVSDDGTHSVTHDPTDVVVNGAGVAVSCFGFTAGAGETVSLTTMACTTLQRTDDGVHSASESGGTVYVNGVGARLNCLVTVIVPETFFLP